MRRINIRWMILFDRVLAFLLIPCMLASHFAILWLSRRFYFLSGIFFALLSIRILNFNFVSLPEGCLKMNNERTVFEFKLISLQLWLFGWTALQRLVTYLLVQSDLELGEKMNIGGNRFWRDLFSSTYCQHRIEKEGPSELNQCVLADS